MGVDGDRDTQPTGDGGAGPELPEEQRSEPETEPEPKSFIAGIGASAGGLEALEALLKRVRLDGMAFVVVQHLAPATSPATPTICWAWSANR